MASASHPCSINTCERTALAFCNCHNEYFCNDHLMEHSTEPDPLANEVNPVADQPEKRLSEERSCFTTVNKWCRDVYRRMSGPNDGNNQQVELDQTRTTVGESIQDDKVTQDLQPKTMRRHLFPLKRPYQTIKLADKGSQSMAFNEKHLLVEQKPNLCLFDRKLAVVKQIPWTYDHVNMCWSSVLSQFILVTDQAIFTLDENTMLLEQHQIPLHNEENWSCGVCSDTALYLSTSGMSTSLYEYTLQPSIEFVKEWQLFVLNPIYESIFTFTYANGKLALIIFNPNTFQNRLDLRSSTTFEHLWSISIDMPGRCCSINNDQWILTNFLESQLLHISADGKILQDYKDKTSLSSMNPIVNAIQLDTDTIATITMKDLNLHKLS